MKPIFLTIIFALTFVFLIYNLVNQKSSEPTPITPKIPVNERYLPLNAVIEQRLGGGWLIFSINNNKYIYRLDPAGPATTEVLAPYHD